MKIKKIMLTSLWLFIILFFCNIHETNAAFNLETNTATYDSNTGILTIKHSSFHPDAPGNRYAAYLNKIKLGDISPSGYYDFKEGSLKIYGRNKNEINQQNGFNSNNIVKNALSLSKGAISNIYTPPGGINVVMDNPSHPTTLSVKVIGIKPKMRIDSFTSNITTVNGNGGEIILTVRGENLDLTTLNVHNLNSNAKYKLNVTKTVCTVRIMQSANHTQTNRVETFALYSNGVETGLRVSITVSPITTDDNTNTNVPPPNTSNNTNNTNTNTPPPNTSNNTNSSNTNTPPSNTSNNTNSSNTNTPPPNTSNNNTNHSNNTSPLLNNLNTISTILNNTNINNTTLNKLNNHMEKFNTSPVEQVSNSAEDNNASSNTPIGMMSEEDPQKSNIMIPIIIVVVVLLISTLGICGWWSYKKIFPR